MLTNLSKAPFPWFGGKRMAAPAVWEALGDVPHYVEPFAGSLAVLLERPHLANRPYVSETVNDADGLLINAWRSIQMHPDATAEAASWPVAEADMHARHCALVRWHEEHELEHLMGDPNFCDPVMGGWWLWGLCCWIGGGWCDGSGPWWPDENGRLVKRGRPGVSRRVPHVANGRGVNIASVREPGVSRRRPQLSNGRGVNRPQMREPGVELESEFHPVTMPELRRWFGWLSARLRHVRILNGDWTRAVTTGASLTLPVRQGDGPCGVFLDPPYGESRDQDIYRLDDSTLHVAVREWALKHGGDRRYRIVVAGFEGEHDELEAEGWQAVEWYTQGYLTGGMGNLGEKGHQQSRERLWLSPHCLKPEEQGELFEGVL